MSDLDGFADLDGLTGLGWVGWAGWAWHAATCHAAAFCLFFASRDKRTRVAVVQSWFSLIQTCLKTLEFRRFVIMWRGGGMTADDRSRHGLSRGDENVDFNAA
ncbi:hypothetical protein [Bifidobacterium jacchi]|uniref:Uncharacterized protein n=1 Tax=Bifidobacterium jacchi TaxID=2490545 RepID=A0A5N5RLH3_9BIFI|nr:hypothetical protein [Bifidobacterium jacchi]KAB5608137.1 hypothetical protein EHS19_02050 [Bifidobacterium jacchi]